MVLLCCLLQQDVDLQDIVVDQILSGLSNQLFKVSIREDYPERSRFAHGEVLFRIYGKDVNSLYDSSTEVCVFKMLGARGIAPHLIAEVDVCWPSFLHVRWSPYLFLIFCVLGRTYRGVD